MDYSQHTKEELIELLEVRDRENEKMNDIALEYADVACHLFSETSEMLNLANKQKGRQDKFSKALLPVVVKLYEKTGKRPQPLKVLEAMVRGDSDLVQEIDYDQEVYWLKGSEESRQIKSLADRITTIITNNSDKFPSIKLRKRKK